MNTKLINFYNKVEKNNSKLRLFITFFSISAFLTSVFCAFFYDPYSEPYFLYFTHLSVLIVSIFYLTLTISKYLNISLLSKIDNYYIRNFMNFNIFVTGWLYMGILFPALVIGLIIGTWAPVSITQWVIVTLAMHLVIPIIVWLDFRTTKYKQLSKNSFRFLSMIVWPAIYASISLIYGTYSLLFPYPFLDYIRYPILTAYSLPMLLILFPTIAHYLDKKYKQQIKI